MRCTHAEGAAMAEYIEREAAIKELMNDAIGQVGYSREDAADCIRFIDAADVVPVIFCKYCKHFHAVIIDEKTGEVGDWGICDQPWRNEGYDVNETDYCSSAEPK